MDISSCIERLGNDRMDIPAITELAASLRENKKFSAASIISCALKDFPYAAELYVLAAEDCLTRGKPAEAACFCMDGIARAGDTPALHSLLARIAIGKKDYSQALARAQILRQKFPALVDGYKYGVEAAITSGDWRMAAEICKSAITHAPQALKEISISPDQAGNFLQWAKEPLETSWHMEALRRLKVCLALFPDMPEGYAESAKIYLLQQRPHKAENICLAGLAALPSDNSLFGLLVDACLLAKKHRQAVNYAFLACVLAPGQRQFVEDMVYRLLEHDLPLDARNLFARQKNLFAKDFARARLELALDFQIEPKKKTAHLTRFLENAEKLFKLDLPLSWNARYYLNQMAMLAATDSLAQKRHRAYMEVLLEQRKPAAVTAISKKLCFYGHHHALSFFSAVLRQMRPGEIDIISRDKDFDPQLIKHLGLEAHKFVDKSKIYDYGCIISDALNHKYGAFKPNPGQTMLCFWHSSDAIGAMPLPGIGGFILPFQKTAHFNTLYLAGNEYEMLPAGICEIAYTGLYHVDRPDCMDKSVLRKQIEREYGVKLDPCKSLVYLLDSEICNHRHIIYSINKISKYANVLFKPNSTLPQRLLREISPLVTVIKDQRMANNLLRFAADYIMAEFNSGSCASSLMLGLPLIPFYSRVVSDKYQPKMKPAHYMSFLYPEDRHRLTEYNINSKRVYLNYLKNNNLLFDLLDTDRIKNIICNNTLSDLFAPHLEKLQKMAFGDYIKDEPARKTADFIRRFAREGTFGKDCAAILL